MNNTIVIFRLPGRGPEVWLETVFERHFDLPPFRKATLGDRNEAIRMADAMLWESNKHEENDL